MNSRRLMRCPELRGRQSIRWLTSALNNCCIAMCRPARCPGGVTNGIVPEVLIRSLGPPIDGLARRSAEDARLVPDSDTEAPYSSGRQYVVKSVLLLSQKFDAPINYRDSL